MERIHSNSKPTVIADPDNVFMQLFKHERDVTVVEELSTASDLFKKNGCLKDGLDLKPVVVLYLQTGVSEENIK